MYPPEESSDQEPDLFIESIKAENDQLKLQLMTNSLINELVKVMNSSTDLPGITKTMLLGIVEILQFNRVILFRIDAPNFQLIPDSWVGIENIDRTSLSIPLGFEGGDITDAIFLNRHLIVDQPDPDNDVFCKLLASNRYIVMPLISKASRKCWEYKSCNRQTCPAYGSFNPYCWSIPGSGELLGALSENERRSKCIACQCFKAEGVLWIDRNNSDTTITSDDISTLSTILNFAGIIIENFRILNELEKANTSLTSANDQLRIVNRDLQIAQTKINNDLKQAKSIQEGLLPSELQNIKPFTIAARYIPAIAVGGDYYDVFPLGEDRYGIIVADVSGHGIASALIMSMVKVVLKSNAHNESSPQKTLERINTTFMNEIKTDNFVTVFYAIVDTRNKTITHSSAGHCPILRANKATKTCEHISADGLFLGIFPDMMLHEIISEYIPGCDRLVLFTDGITESHNAAEEMFDLPRLEDAVIEGLTHSPKEAMETIFLRHKTFCGAHTAPEDDITLLIIDF